MGYWVLVVGFLGVNSEGLWALGFGCGFLGGKLRGFTGFGVTT